MIVGDVLVRDASVALSLHILLKVAEALLPRVITWAPHPSREPLKCCLALMGDLALPVGLALLVGPPAEKEVIIGDIVQRYSSMSFSGNELA